MKLIIILLFHIINISVKCENDLNILKYEYFGDKTVQIQLSRNLNNDLESYLQFSIEGTSPHWVGIGFGDSMNNTDMIIAEFYTSDDYRLHDTFSYGLQRPKNDSVLGGNFDLYEIEYKLINDGKNSLKFKRKLRTEDVYDKDLQENNGKIIIAWGEGSFKYHKSNYYVRDFNFNKKWSLNSFWDYHAFLMISVWTVSCSIANLSIKFLKKYFENYLLIHIISGMCCTMTSTVILIASIFFYSKKNINENNKIHIYAGYTFFGCEALISITGSILLLKLYIQLKIFNQIGKPLKKLHGLSAFITSYFSYFCMLSGIKMFYGLNNKIIILVGICLFINLILDFLKLSKNLKIKNHKKIKKIE